MKTINEIIAEKQINDSAEINHNHEIVIQEIVDIFKGCKKEEREEVMSFVRLFLKNLSSFDVMQIEKNMKIKQNYPNKATNVAQWVLAKIA